MASSRWKRFAFFERQTLQLSPDVLEDLIPSAGNNNNKSLRSALHLAAASQESVALAVSTAALPLLALQQQQQQPGSSSRQQQQDNSSNKSEEQQQTLDAISAMWSSLAACSSSSAAQSSAMDTTDTTTTSIQLPSQGQAAAAAASSAGPVSSATTTTTVLDGLVLAFVSSKETPLLHCFDITVRCNSNAANASPPSTTGGSSTTYEDMDGWRGYWAPFASTSSSSSSNEQVDDAAGGPSNLVAIAACRLRSSKTTSAANQPQPHSPLHLACLGKSTTTTSSSSRNTKNAAPHKIVVWEDPHLHLVCRKPLSVPSSTSSTEAVVYSIPAQSHQQSQSHQQWNTANDGEACVIDIVPGLVAVGTLSGVVLIYAYYTETTSSSSRRILRPYLRIPSPPAEGMYVVSVQLSISDNDDKASVFVAYNRETGNNTASSAAAAASSSSASTAGICCYEIPLSSQQSSTLSAPSARHDLDGRYVGSSSLVDSYQQQQDGKDELMVTVARPDGLYSYSQTERTGVAPIDGTKLAICLIPPPVPAEKARQVDLEQVGSGYALVASTDSKSGRDAVDIYDSTNKLVAFHLLLSPGHRALRASGVTTLPTSFPDGSVRGGRSSAVVLTSGGSLVTFTEKLTEEKISLLVQKNLYSAAIVVAYADPSYEAADITTLYQRYAEHLYRKGDFSGAIDQYTHTIGSLESSHVIFRYLDAPKIPLLVKYLEQLRSRELASAVHNELLRTCYLKLNDIQAAESIAVSASHSVSDASLESILSNLSNKPKDALATICSLEAPHAARILNDHGASLARALPRETAGVVISLCLGTYTPRALADVSMRETLGAAAATTTAAAAELNKLVSSHEHPKAVVIEPYPVHLFASAFVEHPKMLRLILAHCNRNKCPLTPSLRRTLLELTLAEWNQAKRSGDTEAEKLRHKEAIASLTDSHCRDIGDYDALVIVQQAGFEEGELLLYERLQMTPLLLERYAKDGTEKSRRQMLAMCQTDPEVLADVLGHFVEIASEKLSSIEDIGDRNAADDWSDDDEAAEIMEDIQEALTLARRQGVLPPVRIARILAGEGTGQFSADRPPKDVPRKRTVPLSVSLDYVGTILEESRKESTRLKGEIEEYNQLCNSMENEIDSLMRTSFGLPSPGQGEPKEIKSSARLNTDELYTKIKSEEVGPSTDARSEQTREDFWREMNQTEDSIETIARFFAKGAIT